MTYFGQFWGFGGFLSERGAQVWQLEPPALIAKGAVLEDFCWSLCLFAWFAAFRTHERSGQPLSSGGRFASDLGWRRQNGRASSIAFGAFRLIR